MKKTHILVFIMLLILTSYFTINIINNCLKDKILVNNIITTTYQDKNMIIGISYPKTNTNLDNKISKYIDKELKYFKENFGDSDYLIDRDEINIDYKYKVFKNRYISLVLTTYINSYKLTSPIYEVISYFYDTKEDKYLRLDEILNDNDKLVLFNYIGNKLKNDYSEYIIPDNVETIYSLDKLNNYSFFIDNDNIYFYFTPDNLASDYYDILTIKMPISLVKFKINLNLKNKIVMNNYSTTSVSNIIDPTKKVVALTFDDGPSTYTKEIIDILKENDVNATFFILGNKVDNYQDVLLESIKNGNELGNHSYNHKWLSRLSTNNLIDQIESTQNILKEKLNYEPVYLRPTYGSITNRIKNNTSLKISLWTVDTKDWKIKSVDRIVKKATSNIEDGDIILMHDIFERSKDALKEIIPILKNQGFQLVTLSELEEVKLLRSNIE